MTMRLHSRFYITTIALTLVLAMSACGSGSEDKQATEGVEADQRPEVAAVERDPLPGEVHFKSLRQITFEGDSAEAYWSWDGELLIFQATRDAFECDQVFTVKPDGSDLKLVSTGRGRTTCSFIVRGNRQIIYSSTHHLGDACPELPPLPRHSYAWVFFDYDIFKADIDGANPVNLTNSPGYDAEGTISPDGRTIVFSSTRSGDQEIYTMDIEGGNLQRLTDELGYDGGPFWSWDGSKIVYRSYHPKTEEQVAELKDAMQRNLQISVPLEIFVMDADGGNKRQVTSLGAASFAPFMHPDGKRIIFASNHEKGRGNFELCIINIDGTGLESVTKGGGYNSFPMFSRDGKYLAFVSSRDATEAGKYNVYIAEWVD